MILDGPDSVAVTMTADAADRTAQSLLKATRQVRASEAAWEGEFDAAAKTDSG